MFRFVRERQMSENVRQNFVAPPSPIPPAPRLQVRPAADWQAFHQAQMERLSRYEWISIEEGHAQIPVRRAMEILVEREGRTENR
jgi:hypothetical protein